MVTATEIVRVGERGYLSIYAENGYATSRNNTIVARIYKENEPEPVKTVGFDTSRPGPTVWAASPIPSMLCPTVEYTMWRWT
ncbi:hypothetical protein NXV89_15685 [Bacteroides uniformis]|nr:hypothetical protein [Bacteroides uniformis]